MPVNPYIVVDLFEQALAEYTGAKYAVATSSCTAALLITLKHLKVNYVKIPKFTYCSVPQAILLAGGFPEYEDVEWKGKYRLKPYPVWDCARLFTSGMYEPGTYQCVSFHWKKTLAIGQGGAILHDNDEADALFRKMRFNGRTAGVVPKEDTFPVLGWPFNMMPRDAAEGLSRLSVLPAHNDPKPNDDYVDLSTIKTFEGIPTWDV